MHLLAHLILSGLSLRSVQELVSFVAHRISCEELVLENVTFAEETAEEIQLRRVPASRSVLEWIRVSHTLQDRDAIQRWMKTSSILFASQGFVRPDDTTLALVESYLHALLSHSGHAAQIQHLHVQRSNMNDGVYFHLRSDSDVSHTKAMTKVQTRRQNIAIVSVRKMLICGLPAYRSP